MKSSAYSIALLINVVFMSCQVLFVGCFGGNSASMDAASNNYHKLSAEYDTVIRHYKMTGDMQKVKAAEYLIANIDGHYFSTSPFLSQFTEVLFNAGKMDERRSFIIQKFDSLHELFGKMEFQRVPDQAALTSEMLIENIDYAFRAWKMPWAKNLSFDEFCKYILPYKVGTEKPTFWRRKLFEQFAWVADSFRNETDRAKVCTVINEHLSWFKFQWPFTYPIAQDYDCMVAGKTGRCTDATTLATYAMRALGIPVTVDFTPQWANRNYGHHWNSLMLQDGRFVNFQGTETPPGLTKIEYDPNEGWFFKRAKIYRNSFAKTNVNVPLQDNKLLIPYGFDDQNYEDVTSDFIPVSDIEVKVTRQLDTKMVNVIYLCVFDNEHWVPVDWTFVREGLAIFKDIGKGVLYIGAGYESGVLNFLTNPFILSDDGGTHYLDYYKNIRSARLFRKYPYNNSNNVKIGDRYELFYWRNGWQSLGQQVAKMRFIDFKNIPDNSLLLLKNLDRGKQERPFTLEGEEQVFW